MEGKPFTVWRPQGAAPAAASVKVQVDSAAPVTATVSGSSWSAAIAKQKRGTHTLKATLYLGGAERATASRTFVVR